MTQPEATKVVLYPVEKKHLDGLRTVATRLLVTGDPMSPEEMRNAATIIMQAVRHAEALEAFRRPGTGELYVHVTPKEE